MSARRSGSRGSDTADGPVVARGEGIRTGPSDAGREEARAKFGGMDIPATLSGTFAALGLTLFLAGLLSALGAYGTSEGMLNGSATELSVAGAVTAGVVLFLAFLFGGWVAGRMARYDGARNGFMTAVWFILATVVVSGVGALVGNQFNLFGEVTFSGTLDGETTAVALGVGFVALALTLLAGALGGKLGDRYHKRADRLIASTRTGAVAREGAVYPDSGQARSDRSAAERSSETSK